MRWEGVAREPPSGNHRHRSGRAGAGASGAGGHTITVHLQQTFNLSGAAGDLKGQLQEAGRITERELERMLERLLRNKLRMAN